MDHLYVASGSPRFGRALSLGCGKGHLERAMVRLGIASEVDAIDGSAVSIELARAKADEEGFTTVHYRQADLNQLDLPRNTYDAVVFHQSLHHVSSVEKLLERVRRSLKPNGLLFLDEWTGPSRFEWSAKKLARASGLFESVPAAWKKWPECRPPIEAADPSEAVRSSAILPAVHRLFSTVLERPYGGHVVALLLPQLARERAPAAELDAIISRWLEAEDQDLERNRDAGFYTALVASPRRGLRLIAGRTANLGVRVLLAFRYRVWARVGGSPAHASDA
ncbi:MAG TPA: class I SAM-dependent methyltransferase [Thermoanaerobaculia bacterium]